MSMTSPELHYDGHLRAGGRESAQSQLDAEQ